MGYIEEAFKRVDIQHIRDFVLHGAEANKISDLTYKERLDDSTASMYVRLKNLCQDEEDYDDTMDDFHHALSVYTNVYTEIGIKIGAKLQHDLLLSDKMGSDQK